MTNECTHPIRYRQGSPSVFKCWECRKVIIDKSHNPSNTMGEYIKKSDVQNLLSESINQPTNDYTQGRYDMLCELGTLPTINPERVLEEMMETMIAHAELQKSEGRADIAQRTIDAVYPLKESLYRIRNQS